MGNLVDYSSYVIAAYAVAGSLLVILGAVTISRYLSIKNAKKKKKK